MAVCVFGQKQLSTERVLLGEASCFQKSTRCVNSFSNACALEKSAAACLMATSVFRSRRNFSIKSDNQHIRLWTARLLKRLCAQAGLAADLVGSDGIPPSGALD